MIPRRILFAVAAVCLAAALLIVADIARGANGCGNIGYAYPVELTGTPGQTVSARITLVPSVFPEGHVAAYVNASAGADWLQAGVTQDAGGATPFLYAEYRTAAGYRLFHLGVAQGAHTFLLEPRGTRWAAVVDGRTVASVVLPGKPVPGAMVEQETTGSRTACLVPATMSVRFQ